MTAISRNLTGQLATLRLLSDLPADAGARVHPGGIKRIFPMMLFRFIMLIPPIVLRRTVQWCEVIRVKTSHNKHDPSVLQAESGLYVLFFSIYLFSPALQTGCMGSPGCVNLSQHRKRAFSLAECSLLWSFLISRPHLQ